jgi:transcription initiation factor TFIID TATA-box-binding protein
MILELSSLSVELGLENVEYEPEKFPGLIYRGTGTTTISIFRTGKISIMGSKTYAEVVEALNNIINSMESVGVELDLDANFDNIE